MGGLDHNRAVGARADRCRRPRAARRRRSHAAGARRPRSGAIVGGLILAASGRPEVGLAVVRRRSSRRGGGGMVIRLNYLWDSPFSAPRSVRPWVGGARRIPTSVDSPHEIAFVSGRWWAWWHRLVGTSAGTCGRVVISRDQDAARASRTVRHEARHRRPVPGARPALATGLTPTGKRRDAHHPDPPSWVPLFSVPRWCAGWRMQRSRSSRWERAATRHRRCPTAVSGARPRRWPGWV